MAQLVMLRPSEAPPPSVPDGPSCRLATDADAPELARLLRAAFPEQNWTVERVGKDLLDAPDVPHTFVIAEAGALIATASVRYLERFAGHGYVHWVAVDPRARGRRLAMIAMGAVLQAFAEDGHDSAILETDDHRLPAIASYLGQGFIPHYTDPDHPLRWSRVFAAMAQRRTQTKDK